MCFRGVFISNVNLDKKSSGPASFADAIAALKEGKRAKFDETVEIAINLDAKTDLTVRGSLEAPNALGRDVKIAVFSDLKLDNVTYSGGEDLIARFLSGEIKKCDTCISSRKYMPMVSTKIGKILGKKRIIPDARFGTVTEDDENSIKRAVDSFKKGRMNFRANKNVIHAVIGKISLSDDKLEENFLCLVKEVKSLLPPKARIKEIMLSSTMFKGSLEVKAGNI